MGILKQIISFLSSLFGSRNTNWRVEPIPANAYLFRRIHFGYVIEDKQSSNNFRPNPSAFKDNELSCDWNKYSTPQKSLELIGKEHKPNKKNGKSEFKDFNDFFIVSFHVKQIIDNNYQQEVLHNPLLYNPVQTGSPNNRAHSLVKGEKEGNEAEEVKVRFWLSKLSKWEIFDETRFKMLDAKRKAQRP
jgi:hypothetical protein